MKRLLRLVAILLLLAPANAVKAQFTFTTNNGALTITRYTGPGGSVTIPSTINGLPVTSIGMNAFYGCGSLTNLTIPSCVIYIYWDAFLACDNLSGLFFKGEAPIAFLNQVQVYSPLTVYYLPGTAGWPSTFVGRPTFLWNPRFQTGDGSFGVASNRFNFNVTGTADIPIVLEACTNLANSKWETLQSCTLTNGSLYFSDPNWMNHPARLYRIRSP